MDIRSVSGFPEWLPNIKILEQHLMDQIRHGFELHGFAPIETPAVERLEVLDAKGGVGRQIFRVARPAMEEEAEGASLALHFDLTVPLARYVVQHANELTFPFRRYQIQKVWRGERAQRGRFREFYQCDIDIIGRGNLDLLHDAEIPGAISQVFGRLGIANFTIHVSNRKILSALTTALGVDQFGDAVLRIVDNYHKATPDEISQSLVNEGLSLEAAETFLRLCQSESFESARKVMVDADAEQKGLDELEAVVDSAIRLGVPQSQLRPDFSIARGLDYYTGTVFETFLQGKERWGSVCSGGRYDNLTTFFDSSVAYPGVGISIGLTRLIHLLTTEGLANPDKSTPTQVLIAVVERSELDKYLSYAALLRSENIPTEVYLQQSRLADQLSYASSLGIQLTVICGPREREQSQVTIRSMSDRSQVTKPEGELVDTVKSILGNGHA